MLVLPNYISEELDIIKAFNENQENILSDFIDNIDDHIKIHEVKIPFLNPSEKIELGLKPVEHLAGLSNEDYNVRDIFTEMMPIYQRQAMLLTLWAAFESELKQLYCHKYEVERIPKRPQNKSDLQNILDCFSNNNPAFNPSIEYNSAVEILNTEVRSIRNAWVHEGGADPKNELSDDIKGIEIKSSKIVISKEYIIGVIKLMQVVSAGVNSSFNNAAIKKINKDT